MLFSGRGYWYVAIVTLHFLHLTSHLSHIHISYCITLLTCYITPWSHVCIQCLEYISFTQNPGRAPPPLTACQPLGAIFTLIIMESMNPQWKHKHLHTWTMKMHTCNTQIVAHTAQADVQWNVWAPRQCLFIIIFESAMYNVPYMWYINQICLHTCCTIVHIVTWQPRQYPFTNIFRKKWHWTVLWGSLVKRGMWRELELNVYTNHNRRTDGRGLCGALHWCAQYHNTNLYWTISSSFDDTRYTSRSMFFA